MLDRCEDITDESVCALSMFTAASLDMLEGVDEVSIDAIDPTGMLKVWAGCTIFMHAC